MSDQLNKEQRDQHSLQTAEIQATANFLKSFEARRNEGVQVIQAYDSVHATAEVNQSLPEAIPASLVAMFDSVVPENREYLLSAIETGIKGYKDRHDGEAPRADMVAAALSSGLQAIKAEFDSAGAIGTQLSAGGHEALAVIPTQAIVTISTQIANALPIVAYLPNPTGSNALPLVYARTVANTTWGETKANDFIDGPAATCQYFDSQFEFQATQDDANPRIYTLKPTIAYKDNISHLPDPNQPVLPFIGGRVRVMVNGVEVGHDATTDHAKFSGLSTIIGLNDHGLVLDGVKVKLQSGEADLDKGEITVTFAEELPAGTEVSVNLIADFERKNGKAPVLDAPGVDMVLKARSLHAYSIRALYRATDDAISQAQNELGLDPRGAFTAIVASKQLLESNIRLLRRGKRRAKGFKRVLVADLGRGVTDAAAFNNTSDLARELTVTISAAKLDINKLLDVVPSGHDIYIGDTMAVLFDQLADDTHYKKAGVSVGAPNQITRIGSFPGGTNVYHVPTSANLLDEHDDAAEIMVIGRSTIPVRNAFTGFVARPLTIRESNTVDFEQGVTAQTRVAAELNPLERFADQIVVIEVVNLPASLIKK
ncbi:hypothetical protein HCY58_11705 [Acinetobacter radioresistens]|uniref:hypothetical protein n=1 Tax=Acinetobacter radioresistens TaxID=40216 RepID=UPI0020066EAD|nr:hypothetical protein [Acinetobacter radioresistens]MCK4087711.1 hypothetical protein [Acinetobacter radioresistens]MCK4093504.1 hypothetical protein [Acinetobacter radioresistens]